MRPQRREPGITERSGSSPRAASASLIPSFSAFAATSARRSASRHSLSSSASWGSAHSHGILSNDDTAQRLSISKGQRAAVDGDEKEVDTSSATALEPAPPAKRTRALTSSERGRQFRLRERAHEQSLMKQLIVIREQIAQLESSRDLLKQRSLMTRTSSGGSLERIVRELYWVYRYGLESLDPGVRPAFYSTSDDQLAAIVNYKEKYMRGVVDHDVLYGDLVGINALLEQWRKHTLSTSRFEIEIVRVEPIVGSKTHPIVVIHTKQHARYSRETLPVMFPGVLERCPDLARKFIGRDITFDCISRFTFSERDQITNYSVSINIIEALVKTVGSARDVAELMTFSVVTPSMEIQDVGDTDRMLYSTFEPRYGDTSEEGELLYHEGRTEMRSYASYQTASLQGGLQRHGYDDRAYQSREPQSVLQTWNSDEESEDSTQTYIFRV